MAHGHLVSVNKSELFGGVFSLNLVVLVLYFGCQVVSNVADVSDLVFHNQGDVGTHRKRYLKQEVIRKKNHKLNRKKCYNTLAQFN